MVTDTQPAAAAPARPAREPEATTTPDRLFAQAQDLIRLLGTLASGLFFWFVFFGMPVVPGPIFGTVLVTLGGVLFVAAFRSHRKLAAIRNLPCARVGSVSLGLARLEGQIRRLSSSVAPFSGTPAIYWQIEAHQYEPATSDDPPGWRRVLVEQHWDEAFQLEDASGSIAVLTHGADLMLATSETTTFDGAAWGAATGSRREFLGKLVDRLPFAALPDQRPVRVREIRLEDGATVSTVGTVAVAEDATLPLLSEAEPTVYLPSEGANWLPVSLYRTGLEELERWMARHGLSGAFAPDYPEVRSPSAGLAWDGLTEAAWTTGGWDTGAGRGEPDRTGRTAVAPPVRCRLPDRIDHRQLVVGRGQSDRPFVISARPGELPDGHLLTWMRLGLVVGPAFILWGLLGLLVS